MPVSNNGSTGRRIVDQILVGQISGTVFGVLLFGIETLWAFRGAYEFLGEPLSKVLLIHALSGWIVGTVVGLVLGGGGVVLSGRTATRWSFGVVPVTGFVFSALFLVRDYTVARLETIPTGALISLFAAGGVWVGLSLLTLRRWRPYREGAASGSIARVRGGLALLCVLVLVVTAVWSTRVAQSVPKAAGAADDAPNVVLILIDALRSDHLSCYGYARPTSPNIDRLGEDGTIFTRTYSHGNRTIISVPSLFTSLYPSLHGAIGFHDQMVPLGQDKTTMAELFKRAGYTTAGMMSNIYLKKPFGLTQGFDRLEEFNSARFRLSLYRVLVKLGMMARPDYETLGAPDARAVSDAGIKWLQRMSPGPYFLYLHYMDVHHPYEMPRGITPEFGDTDAETAKRLFIKTAQMVRHPPPLKLPPEELQRLIDMYDSCIHYTDAEIGRVISAIENDPSGRETIVIVTADHGDEFLEHGSLYHTNLLLEELLSVPLIVWSDGPTVGQARVDSLTRLVDVLPTLAEIIHVPAPAGIEGHSLLPFLRGEGGRSAEYTIAEGDFCASLNEERWKLVLVDSSGTYELYDLKNDPHASTNVSAEHPGELQRLKKILDDYLVRAEEEGTRNKSTVSDETLRQLKALGYI